MFPDKILEFGIATMVTFILFYVIRQLLSERRLKSVIKNGNANERIGPTHRTIITDGRAFVVCPLDRSGTIAQMEMMAQAVNGINVTLAKLALLTEAVRQDQIRRLEGGGQK